MDEDGANELVEGDFWILDVDENEDEVVESDEIVDVKELEVPIGETDDELGGNVDVDLVDASVCMIQTTLLG